MKSLPACMLFLRRSTISSSLAPFRDSNFHLARASNRLIGNHIQVPAPTPRIHRSRISLLVIRQQPRKSTVMRGCTTVFGSSASQHLMHSFSDAPSSLVFFDRIAPKHAFPRFTQTAYPLRIQMLFTQGTVAIRALRDRHQMKNLLQPMSNVGSSQDSA